VEHQARVQRFFPWPVSDPVYKFLSDVPGDKGRWNLKALYIMVIYAPKWAIWDLEAATNLNRRNSGPLNCNVHPAQGVRHLPVKRPPGHVECCQVPPTYVIFRLLSFEFAADLVPGLSLVHPELPLRVLGN